ncbi:hypothetical protein QEP73_16310 [Pseudomonas defluvii]|nr:hypothetical protein QEP73_16310 [Pseudomonas defluvii]
MDETQTLRRRAGSGKFDILVPEAKLSGSALFNGEPKERNVTGLIDPRLRFSVNLYGAPAMSLAEFPRYQQDVIIGAGLAITAPLGQYDAGTFYTDNNEFLGDHTLPLNRNHSLKLNASNGGHTRTGSEYDSIGIVWQYRFGGGL